MRILRLTCSPDAGQHRVEIAVEVPGLARRTAVARFPFAVTDKDRELIRWYFEDYREGPADAVTRMRAARAERRLGELGRELHTAVFSASPGTDRLWAAVQPDLARFRVEIVTDPAGATALPWEGMTDPDTGEWLALAAGTMVRTHPGAAGTPRLPKDGGPVRALVVIARPGVIDVPYRSVTLHLARLQEASPEAVDLTVLRPPTFAHLTRMLQAATDAGTPYQVVHFDGHGVWGDTADPEWLGTVIRAAGHGPAGLWLASPARPGAHGYLLFENPAVPGNAQLVDGPALANLLTDAGVPVLTLNACRSALAEAGPPSSAGLGDPHAEVRAFGSLAQEVMDAGATGVLAMRYNVYVATAARLVADVYARLVDGQSFGAAVTAARTTLAEGPPAGPGAVIQDWMVPIAYEAIPLHLTTRPTGSDPAGAAPSAQPQPGGVRFAGDSVPAPPAWGFYGRDDTLLDLDRAFDAQPIVLLHGEAGIGKTTTAAEFARWYTLTGGAQPPVIYTSLAEHTTMTGLATSLAAGLTRMRQMPMLWILDDLQAVSGSPGHPPAWAPEGRQELLTFLRSTRETKTRLLLLSRGDEQAWLGDLAARLFLPRLPPADLTLLRRAVAAAQHTPGPALEAFLAQAATARE